MNDQEQGSNMDDFTTKTLSNQEFLQVIFGEDWRTAHVTSFPDDPTNIIASRRSICWSGRYFGNTPLPPGNQYFTISRFDPVDGRAVRRKANFIACYVIAADDVREKLPVKQVEKLPKPTYKMRSSSGSEQWGWVLAVPCRDANRINNLFDGLVKRGLSPDGTDPGMTGVTRYVRLPGGYNSKKSRLINGVPFDCELLELNRWERYTLEHLAEPFEIDLDADRKETSSSNSADVNHPLIEVIAIKNKLASGKFDITCPWLDEHTDGDDSGTAAWTNDDLSIGFKCHHGHCQDRNAKDLINWIEEDHPGWSEELEEWKVYKFLEVGKKIDEIEAVEVAPKIPTMESVLDTLLSELNDISNPAEADEHAFKILRVADKVGKASQVRVHDTVRKHLGWTKKNFGDVLKEQRVKWYVKENIGDLKEHKRLNPYEFPHKEVSENGVRLYDTVANTRHLLAKYKITTNFDQITKKNFLFVPDDKSTEEADFLETIIGLVRLNDMPQINIQNRINGACRENPINQVVNCLNSLDYNGVGYIQQLAEHIIVEKGTEHIRDEVLRLWMIMACAAADYAESTPNKKAVPKFDSVMIFVGKQGLKKTQFFRAMLPFLLRQYFCDGQFIDPTDKDSVSQCIQWWIVEAGEIDGLFKKADIGRFKAFLSKSFDIFRKSFARLAREYQRRTAFVGSANEREFLKDHTGNRRYWPLLVRKLTIPTNDDLLNSAWAEAWKNYTDGEQWWPTEEFEKVLLEQVASFQVPITDEPVEESIRDLIARKMGMFACNVVMFKDIRNALKSNGLYGHNIEKMPSLTMIGKIMRRHGLGVSFRTARGVYWLIRDFDKGQKMSAAEIERLYTTFHTSTKD